MERFKSALQRQKACSTEAQRREYALLLRAVAPELVRQGNTRGMINKVATHLGVPYGIRWVKTTKKEMPYAFTQAVAARAQFEEAAAQAAKPKEDLPVGDAVLCRGQIALLSAYDPQSKSRAKPAA